LSLNLFSFSLETIRQGPATVRQELFPHPQRPFAPQGYGEFFPFTPARFHANRLFFSLSLLAIFK
jgi:hypothetical protein